MTGIKAHTIRIWEKRYGILNPERVGGNIRVYSLTDLQKILNLSLLVQNNFRISKLAKLSDGELAEHAKQISKESSKEDHYLNRLTMSMFSFNEQLFEEVYQEQIEVLSFEEIFIHTYAPLLNYIGLLWQTDGINPAHEHFISNLIRQKIALNLAKFSRVSQNAEQVHVLFLPQGEIHDIGLQFLDYRLKSSGEKTIYLGKDIPFDDLLDINSQFEEINWVCSFMIDKSTDEKQRFIEKVSRLLDGTENSFWIIGRIWSAHQDYTLDKRITFYEGFHNVLSTTERVKTPPNTELS